MQEPPSFFCTESNQPREESVIMTGSALAEGVFPHGNRGDIFLMMFSLFSFSAVLGCKMNPAYMLVFSADWNFKLFTQILEHILGNIPKIHGCTEVQPRLFKVQNLVLCPCFFSWIPKFPGEFPWYFPKFLEKKIIASFTKTVDELLKNLKNKINLSFCCNIFSSRENVT